MSEYYLMHAGRSKRDGAKVGSGRYPLGSGKRPFQGEDDKTKKKHHFFTSKKKKQADKEAEEKKPLSDEEKKAIISTGNVRKAYEKRAYLSNEDIDAVVTRYNKEKSLSDLIPKVDKGKNFMNKVNKVSDFLNTSSKFISGGINAWNAVARINNTFNKDNQMTIIPGLDKLRDAQKSTS